MGGIPITEDAKNKFKEVLKVANGKVKATGYAAGTSHLTVGDLAMVASYRYPFEGINSAVLF